jgi:peptidoglycan/xylan/chitin deacetylase (PgdA/CDA1 family)
MNGSTVVLSSVTRKAAKAAVMVPGAFLGRRPGDVTILLYHRVGVGNRQIDLPSHAFEEQLAALRQTGEVSTLDGALNGKGNGGVVITFDDGYRDFHQHALPLLVKYQLPALLYLATGLVAEGSETLPGDYEPLTWSQLQEAVGTGLVTIGAHTHLHADLSTASERSAEDEMRRSKETIEDKLETACRHFAYPWAVGSVEADRAARRLFDTAALRAWRTNRWGHIDLYRLGRVPVLRSDGKRFFKAKANGRLDTEAILYRSLRRGPWGPRHPEEVHESRSGRQ